MTYEDKQQARENDLILKLISCFKLSGQAFVLGWNRDKKCCYLEHFYELTDCIMSDDGEKFYSEDDVVTYLMLHYLGTMVCVTYDGIIWYMSSKKLEFGFMSSAVTNNKDK